MSVHKPIAAVSEAREYVGICERSQDLHAVVFAVERLFEEWSQGRHLLSTNEEVGHLLALNRLATRLAGELVDQTDQERAS